MSADHIERTERLLEAITAWGQRTQTIRGIALVGSRARGPAREDSDIDLVLLTEEPDAFRSNDWLSEIDWQSNPRPVGWHDARYGVIWSRHVRLDDGLEVEFAFAHPSWANVEVIDEGTKRVVSDGCRILYDPEGLFAALRVSVSANFGQT